MKKKMIMFVYNDLKTDARVMRSINALKDKFDITILASDSTKDSKNSKDGVRFVDVIDFRKTNPLVRYIKCLINVCLFAQRNECDVLYCHDYYSAPLLLFSLFFVKNIKRVYDAHELYIPDSKSSKREKITFLIEKKAIECADAVVCASERRKTIMKQIFKLKQDIVVINNISILPQNKGGIEIDKEMEQFLSNDKITVVYCGVLKRTRRLDLLIDAAEKLKDQIQVLIIGNGDEKDNLIKITNERRLDNVKFMSAIPYKDIYEWISKCDIGYIYYDNSNLNNSNCAPNKIYEYPSAGLPMVGNENPGLFDYFSRYKIGKTSNDIVSAICEVKENYDVYKQNLDIFMKDCSWENEKERLIEAINAVLI